MKCTGNMPFVETKGSAVGMREAVPRMARLALKLARGEEIGPPAEEGYLARLPETSLRRSQGPNEPWLCC